MSKVKVTGQGSFICLRIRLRMITSVCICQLYSNFTYVSLITQGMPPLLISDSKGQRSRSQVRIWFLDDNFNQSQWIKIFFSNFNKLSPVNQEKNPDFRFKRSKVTCHNVLQICFCILRDPSLNQSTVFKLNNIIHHSNLTLVNFLVKISMANITEQVCLQNLQNNF